MDPGVENLNEGLNAAKESVMNSKQLYNTINDNTLNQLLRQLMKYISQCHYVISLETCKECNNICLFII